VVNAYIGPAVQRYVARLGEALGARAIERFMVVKSNGGLTSPENAARYPVHLIESGPAAAIIATAAYGCARGLPNLITFDMGGTTAKAGVVRGGEPIMAAEFYADRLVEGKDLGGYAIRSAVLDLVEVGAGGGSIAWLDEAGVLKVGPVSAGADPGPACYGRSGMRPTVTDAHAVIGTLVPSLFAVSGVCIDRAQAVAAITQHIAEPLGWPVVRAAYAIIDIAVANMAQMVRLATVQRGLDPRDFAMLASGGAGPLHAAAVGEEIGAREVIVPPYPGMFSALGATLGAVRHEVTATVLRPLVELTDVDLHESFARLQERIDVLLAAEPEGKEHPAPERILEARFVGQMFELAVPLGPGGTAFPPIAEIETRFRSLYASEYGFDLPNARVQAVNLRLVAQLPLGSRSTLAAARHDAPIEHPATTPLLLRDGREIAAPLLDASAVRTEPVSGPAIIAHSGATVWLHEGQRAVIDADGSVVITLKGSAV
jgi:N-methylhydantoinase A